MSGGVSTRTWVGETFQAPRDAVNLILGLATGFGILALVRPELANAPMIALLNNWAAWSQYLWGYVGSLLSIHVPRPVAVSLTLIGLFSAIMIRAVVRGAFIRTPVFRVTPRATTWFGRVIDTIGIIFVLLMTFVVTAIATIPLSMKPISAAIQSEVGGDHDHWYKLYEEEEALRAKEPQAGTKEWDEWISAVQDIDAREEAAWLTYKAKKDPGEIFAMGTLLFGALILTILFWGAPRAFWGTLLATAALFGIGAIPIG